MKTILSVGLIAGVILLITGTSITSLVKMVFADPNPDNNGQVLAPGQGTKSGIHRNPSGDFPPPGSGGGSFPNVGQCQKNSDHDNCHDF